MLCGAVILAAGAATRMGRIKQLLPFRGMTLVEHAIQQAQQAELWPVVVVLGAQAGAVAQAVSRTTAESVVNQDWETGMGSSVRAGVNRVLDLAPELDAIVVLLADQPFITAAHLKEMQRLFGSNNAPILAASYAGTVGVPALFHSRTFATLLQLSPESGARALLRGEAAEVQHYNLPEAATDIDTPEDFAALS